METTTDLKDVRMGKKYAFGAVLKIHTIGKIDVVEYVDEFCGTHKGENIFSPYYDGKVISREYSTLERAIIGAISVKCDGINTQADTLIAKMLGMGINEQA